MSVLNKCPVCGSKLGYAALMQYSNIYGILRNGKLSKRKIRTEDNGPMECGYINCIRPECGFYTNCDLDVEEHKGIRIFQNGEIYEYEVEE